MALRPVSPVQLVTRALRIVWSAYHASAWFVDRHRYMAASFGAYRAAAFAIGTGLTRCAGTGLHFLRASRKHGHAIGSNRDGTILGETRSSARGSPRRPAPIIWPALRRFVTWFRKVRYIPRSFQYRSTKIDIMSDYPYMLSDIFDTLSILIDTETICGSISPGKDPLQRTDDRRHSVWLLLSAATRYCCPGGRETFRAARTTPLGVMSHGLVQRYSTVSIRPG